MTKRHSNKLDKISEIDEFEPLEGVSVLTNSVDDILSKEEKYGYLLLRSEELKAVYNTKYTMGENFTKVLITNKRIVNIKIPGYVIDYDLIDQIHYLRMSQEGHWVSYGNNTVEFDTKIETIDFYRRLLPLVLE
ncbi:hypothetical protein AB9M75_11945 [Lactobacillus sp. AN1001]